MMKVLVESGALRRQRYSAWPLLSFATHGALVVAAVAATSRSPGLTERVREAYEELVFAAPAPVAAATVSAPNNSPSTAFPVPDLTIAAPVVPAPAFAVAEPMNVFVSEVGSAPVTPTQYARPLSSALYTSETVERAVQPYPGNPRPEYPVLLRASGIAGDVVVRFIVDTGGRAEPASIEIVESTHEQFSAAVRRWLARTRYLPAEIAGQRVRQLVEQRVGFELRD